MSLSTQLFRGAVALSLLLMFAMLALAATPAEPRITVRIEPAARNQQACHIELARSRTLLLARTPADLETPARWRQTCRA